MAENKPSLGLKLKAFMCKICPFCAAARKWPESSYARKLHDFEKNCTFCRAYHKLHGRHGSQKDDQIDKD